MLKTDLPIIAAKKERARLSNLSRPEIQEKFEYHKKSIEEYYNIGSKKIRGELSSFEIDVPVYLSEEAKEIFKETDTYKVEFSTDSLGNEKMKIEGNLSENKDFTKKYSQYSFYYSGYHESVFSYLEYLLKN